MRVLLTGHDGYIGSVVEPMLTRAGHDCVGLDTGFFGDEPLPPRWVRDVRDASEADLEGFNAVVHLAGLSNDPLGDLDERLTAEINTQASVRLARLAAAAGVRRFVFASSCSLYGEGGAAGADEESALRPLTPYGVSKRDVEEALTELASPSFSPTYLRNATVYGISPRLRLDLVVNDLVAQAVTRGELTLRSDGTAWRPFVHVEDVARVIVSVLEAPLDVVHDQAFNVGRSGENYQIRDVAELISRCVPGSVVTFAPGAVADRRNYSVNFEKFERVLPWITMEHSLRDSLGDMVEDMRQLDLVPAEVAGPGYVRLARIRELQARMLVDADLRWQTGAA
jgi:nucleoside-diphosphate-sugar epimerase